VRYRAFIKLNDYAILSRPTMLEPLPPYKYLSAANRLAIFDAIAQAGGGAPNEAINGLLSNIKQLRIQLSNADTIISKLIFLMLIADSIDVISLINNKYQIHLDNDIELLDQSERDFETAMMREFAMAYYTHMNLDRNPEFFEQGGYIPGWLVRAIFKPNMTLNAIYPDHVNVVRMSRLDPVSFAKEQSNEQTPRKVLLSIRNIVGSALNQIASPNWSQYIAKFHDVNCKIILFNALNDNSDKLSKLDQLQNPYGLKSTPNKTGDGKWVCFDGPLADDKFLRCLVIEI